MARSPAGTGAESMGPGRLNTPGTMSILAAWARCEGRGSHSGKKAKRWRGRGLWKPGFEQG